MGLISLKCSNCGGEIQLDDNKEFGFCMHCGTKVFLQMSKKQKAKIDRSREINNWMELGIVAIESGKYDSAEKYAEKILEQDAKSGMGWFIRALASSTKSDRLWEAFVYYKKAALNMSYNEKINHKSMFILHLADSIRTVVNDKRGSGLSYYGGFEEDGSSLDFNEKWVNNVIIEESEILDSFFSDFSVTERIELLEELFDDAKDAQWASCWEAMMLILYECSRSSAVLGWSNDQREMKLCLNAISVAKNRYGVPGYLPVSTDIIFDVSNALNKYVENNKARVEKADGWWKDCDYKKDDPNHIKIMETRDNAYALYGDINNKYLLAEDVQTDRSIAKWVIGGGRKQSVIKGSPAIRVSKAREAVISRMPEVWDMIIEATIRYGVDQ